MSVLLRLGMLGGVFAAVYAAVFCDLARVWWNRDEMVWADRLERGLTLRHYNHHIRTAALKLLDGGRDTVKALVR